MSDIRDLNFWQTILDLPNRFVTLIWKLFSVKGIALAASIYLIKTNAVGGWEAVVLFLFTVIMVIGGREAEKWKRYLIEIKNGKLESGGRFGEGA